MNTAKKVFYTLSTGIVAGVVLGILFAPDKGAETRDKIRRIKQKLGFGNHSENEHRKALEALSEALEKELAIVNEKIGKLP